ncbi:MAG: WDGH domain-containing protein [Candidatus Hodarchaeales archaeon]
MKREITRISIDKSNISDGYHTFGELYEHRHLLFLNVVLANPKISFKTWFNNGKEKYDGWFILGMNAKYGQISYHIPEKYWDVARVKQLELNSGYDGHNSQDVLIRLMKMLGDYED